MSKSITSTVELKKQLIPVLKSRGVVRAGLFGSFARGQQNQGSDVDLVEYSALKKSIRTKVLADQIPVL